MGTLILLNIIAGVALLIWGLGLVRRGIERGYADNLNRYLAKSSQSRLRSFITGIGITALIQSSTATTLLVSSFAGGRYITLVAALSIMLGGNVGRTLVAQLLAFDLSWLAPAFIILGVASMKIIAKRLIGFRNIGRILLGFAFMFLALSMMIESAAPLKESASLIFVLKGLGNDPILTVLLGIVVTWVFHSSLAFVLLVMSLTSAGVIPFDVAIELVIGANVGSSIPPVLVTAGDDRIIRQVTVGNLLMRFVWAAYLTPLAPWIAEQLIATQTIESGRLLIHFHMGFNILMAITFLPLTGYFSQFLEKILPNKDKKDSPPSVPRFLDEALIEIPSAALLASMRESLRLSEMIGNMLRDTFIAFKTGQESVIGTIQAIDDDVDHLFKAIKIYLVKISREELSEKESVRFVQIFSFAANMEHIGDIIVHNLMKTAEKKRKTKSRFSDEGFEEIRALHKAINQAFKQAENILMTSDQKMAKELVLNKDIIRQIEILSSRNHLRRLQQGNEETLSTTEIHMDVVRDLKRVSNHIIASIYPFVEDKEGKQNDWLEAYNKILSEKPKKD